MVSPLHLTKFRFKQDYSFQEQHKYATARDGVSDIKKIKVYLGQDEGILPKKPQVEDKKSGCKNLPKNRFNQKSAINLKYFTSKLSEIPGPITPNMKQVKDVRKNQDVNKRYDNNIRKVLYESSYQRVSTRVIVRLNFIGRKHQEVQTANYSCFI